MSFTFDFEAARRSLRGTAIGDSLGLVYEGLPAGRNLALYPFPLRQRLFCQCGFVSDDTVQSALVLAAIAAHPDDAGAFQREFARGLRAWFLAIPPGIGLATIKAGLRLCIGISPKRSGVNSAGNGAAMRAAVIGAAFSHDPDRRRTYVEKCTQVTHTHPLALQGAQLIALAAALSATENLHTLREAAKDLAPDWPWETPAPARGPTGYVVHSVNAALQVCACATSFQDAIERVVTLGGDTDSIGAMVGGILAASPIPVEIPEEWEWYMGWPQPVDIPAISQGRRASYFRLLATHVLSLPIILAHGFRRFFPPYG